MTYTKKPSISFDASHRVSERGPEKISMIGAVIEGPHDAAYFLCM